MYISEQVLYNGNLYTLIYMPDIDFNCHILFVKLANGIVRLVKQIFTETLADSKKELDEKANNAMIEYHYQMIEKSFFGIL